MERRVYGAAWTISTDKQTSSKRRSTNTHNNTEAPYAPERSTMSPKGKKRFTPPLFLPSHSSCSRDVV